MHISLITYITDKSKTVNTHKLTKFLFNEKELRDAIGDLIDQNLHIKKMYMNKTDKNEFSSISLEFNYIDILDVYVEYKMLYGNINFPVKLYDLIYTNFNTLEIVYYKYNLNKTFVKEDLSNMLSL